MLRNIVLCSHMVLHHVHQAFSNRCITETNSVTSTEDVLSAGVALETINTGIVITV